MNVHEKVALYISTVRRWIRRINGNPRQKGETNFSDRPYSGMSAAVNEDKAKQADSLFTAYRIITIATFCIAFSSEPWQ